MNRKEKYEAHRRASGGRTVSVRLSAEQADAVDHAGGATKVLREAADRLIERGMGRRGDEDEHRTEK